MRAIYNLLGFHLRLAARPHAAATPRGGFCTRCERVTRWDDRTFRIACRHCGADPVEHADDVTGTPAVEPARVAHPRRRRAPAGA